MAFGTNSKLFMPFLTDVVNGTNPFDLNTHSIKLANYGNTGTPDQTDTAAHCAYNGTGGAWVVANETSNGGWTAGGLALTITTSGFVSNVYSFKASSITGGSTDTLTNVAGCLIYDDFLTSPVADQGICYLAYGGATNGVSGGTFTVNFNTLGIFTITA